MLRASRHHVATIRGCHGTSTVRLLASAPLAAQQRGDDYASIAQLQQRMGDDSPSSEALTLDFRARLRLDPALHSVLQTIPDALKIATALDAKRTKQHGPLYGIPALQSPSAPSPTAPSSAPSR
jgi:amidase